jgi:prefoldin subunit 5
MNNFVITKTIEHLSERLHKRIAELETWLTAVESVVQTNERDILKLQFEIDRLKKAVSAQEKSND